MFPLKHSRNLFVAIIIVANASLSQPAFWQPVDGMRGKFVGMISVDPTGQVFVATDSGLFRSSDHGETWVPLQNGLPEIYLHETSTVAALAANAQNELFAGTIEYGVFRSIDSGTNWFPIGLTGQRIYVLMINSIGHIFAGSHIMGLMRSTDAGNSWNTVLDRGIPIALSFNSHGHLFAATLDVNDVSGMLFRSVDNGDTWTQTSLSFLVVQSLIVNQQGHLFAGTLQPVLPPREDKSGIYRSTDNGENWIRLQPDSALARPFIAAALANNAHDHVYAGGEGSYRSFDHGETWEKISSGLSNLNISVLAFDSAGYLFAGTSGGGLFRSRASTSSVQRRTEIRIESFTLDQCYPNPFSRNGRTTTEISFSVPASAEHPHVVIKIFDLMGRLVLTLLDRNVSPGRHEVVWNGKDLKGTDLPSGTYLYRLEAGSVNVTKRMTLVW